MSEIDTGGHAEIWEDNEGFLKRSDMTLRDWFAGQALDQAMQETYSLDWGKLNTNWPSRVANQAYMIADAMIAARRK